MNKKQANVKNKQQQKPAAAATTAAHNNNAIYSNQSTNEQSVSIYTYTFDHRLSHRLSIATAVTHYICIYTRQATEMCDIGNVCARMQAVTCELLLPLLLLLLSLSLPACLPALVYIYLCDDLGIFLYVSLYVFDLMTFFSEC